MAAMVLTALIGMVCLIVLKLTAALLREYKLLKEVKREIAYLKAEMGTVDALLVNMDAMEELDGQQRESKSKLRVLSRDMEECIALSMYQLTAGHDQTGFLDQLKTLLIVRHNIAKKIQKLKARWEEESHRCERYRLNDYFTMPNQLLLVAIDPRLLALHDEASGLVGISRSKDRIISWLTREGESASQIKAVSIVGCGGIGKSTLAKRVYQAIKGQFDCSAFVSVSRSPNMKWIFEEILSAVGYQGNTLLDTEDQLINKLRKYLKEKRYLIVIDDIWSEQVWNIISFALIENNLRSRVITSTRHHNISSACQQDPKFQGHVYEVRVKPLNDVDSRRLFFKRVFNFGDDDCPEHLRSTSEQIMNKCGGVPLSILSLAGILANQNVMLIENWEKMLSSLNGMDTNTDLETMRHILDLSYRDLSANLRSCMLYLGMFPGDSVISKEDLVRRWIAEGFVCEAYGCTPEEIAESYFNQLLNRSIIQVADFDEHGQAISCRVHGVILDFIMSKAVEENFFTMVDTQQIIRGHTEIRRVYFHVDHTECDRVISSMDLSKIRSLDYLACPKCEPSLPRFQLVRVLHLKLSDWGHFCYDLTFICKMYLLTYLKISSSNGSVLSRSARCTCKLPKRIRALRYLETLDIDANLQCFPEDVCKVSSLSNITVTSSPPPMLPYGIGRLSALLTLKGFSVVGCSVGTIQGLGELRHVRDLELHVDGPVDAQVAAVNSISKLITLKSLVIQFGGSGFRSIIGRHLILQNWGLLRGLHRLHVHGCSLDHYVPDWISQLHMLTSLVLLVDVLSSEGLRVLARLPCLVHLRLSIGQFVDNLQYPSWVCTPRLPQGTILIGGQMFPRLKSFWFRCAVPYGLGFQPGAMPHLESLGMRFVAESVAVQTVPLLAGIEHLTFLASFTAHIDSSVSQNNQFIDWYNGRPPNAVYYSSSPEEQQWWNFVSKVELLLRSVCSLHRSGRPRVHIKYGDMPAYMY